VPPIDYVKNETRCRMVGQAFPERFKELMAAAQIDVDHRCQTHANLAKLVCPIRG
jgi:hypothetical protein